MVPLLDEVGAHAPSTTSKTGHFPSENPPLEQNLFRRTSQPLASWRFRVGGLVTMRLLRLGLACLMVLVVVQVAPVGVDGPGAIVSRRGCCSHHKGVCGCEDGRAACCDGTLSPTCGC